VLNVTRLITCQSRGRRGGIVQRKVLTPALADSLAELEARILAFEAECRRQPRPVRWKFTRQEFDRRLRELEQSTLPRAA
jgi:hypothetical protein